MKKNNISVALCKEYDFITKSAIGFLQEIVAKDDKAEVTIFTMMSGIGEERKQIRYDFYLRYVGGENIQRKGAVSYLFSMVGDQIKENGEEGKDSYVSLYSGVYNEITALKKEISFVGKGDYELEVFECSDSKYAKIDSHTERHKRLVADSCPETVYAFKVV